MAKKRKAKSSRKKARIKRISWGKAVASLSLLVLILLIPYLIYLNHLVNFRFQGDTWAIPSRVYARPLELYPGLKLSPDSLQYELGLSIYQRVDQTPRPGQYRLRGNTIELYTQPFEFSDQTEPAHRLRVFFSSGEVSRIVDTMTNSSLELVRLPPVVIGSYIPENGEDRVLLRFDEIPPTLIKILLAVEDKEFFQHFGVSPVAIARAMIANIRAGKLVQGGSTLTQQLAKNLFLTPERSFTRKVNEAFMALLLELRFDKQTILTAYVNEVFLLQQKNIAVHGFALASQVLFRQSIDHLSDEKLALLVGMVKGPSQYNPILHPESAIGRRNLVLRVMRDHKIIDKNEYQALIKLPLSTVNRVPGVNRFPAYLDLVKRQLKNNYSASELAARGMRIFTPFDPLVQRNLEQGLMAGLARFDQPELEAAVVIADYLSGDIQALVGGREVDFPGFNRAVLAQRPIGSLIKPLLLYSLLEGDATLATRVDDKPIRIRQSDNKIWEPQNYDRRSHGQMSLYQAFVKSYNLPFVHLGVNGGLELLTQNLDRINLLKRDLVYPSLLLGTSEMSAFEVTQMFQVIANQGYFSPLTTIRQVSDASNRILKSIPLDSYKLFDEALMLQVQRAMIGVSEEGTARYLARRFDGQTLAGKTGTTNDVRDSWFAGFTQRRLTVVWLGRDDNTPVNLTGSSGALRVWADIMQKQGFKSFKLGRSDSLEWHYINRFNSGLTQQGCLDSVLLPLPKNFKPHSRSRCE
ncbi:MAG: penicillin-binding protein 1B [Gammaproteobacteria bacterium]|nr:penicillin-binding protein 1B [Gammaproteobacteria bacterium]